ncbi:MAG: hypothetical protein R3F30_05220 [Planctomycetota bacterium]
MAPTKTKKKELIKGPDTEVTTEVLDFIKALDQYKKVKNRPFPTWSEVLEVLKQLGYRQVEDPRPIEAIGRRDEDGAADGAASTAKGRSKARKKATRKGGTTARRRSAR